MASIITATTTSGLTQSADNSGVLQLASGTGNLVTVPSVTGTAMVSGNMPAFSAYASGGTSLPNATWTKVPVNTKDFDTANCYDNTTNYRYTPNVAGYYQVNANLHMNSGVNGRFICSIYKNGTLVRIGGDTSNNNTLGVNVSALIPMNGSTDYIELWAYQAQGVSYALDNSNVANFFQAVMVRNL